MLTIEQEQPDAGFEALKSIAYREAGLVLSPAKAPMIKSRLRHRMKELQIATLSEYCAFVVGDNGSHELPYMISALTTNVSGFFREPHHFDFLSQNVISHLKDKLDSGSAVRIWSAGCSNGQEPYSIAIHMLQANPNIGKRNFKILATDIDTNVLRFAECGMYETAQLSGVDEDARAKYFRKFDFEDSCKFQVCPEVKSMVSFRKLNLHGEWPMAGLFDVIFCRNVVIYFDSETQDRLWPRFGSKLTDEGVIFVGHSERISCSSFELVGATTYSKTKERGSASISKKGAR